MNLVVLVILALVWAVFLIPQVLRSRREVRPADSIGAFQRHLSTLERATPTYGPDDQPIRSAEVVAQSSAIRPQTSSHTRAEVRRRRRDVFLALLAAMVGSLVLGLIPGLRVMLALHVVLDLLFVGYVVLLVRARNAAAERELKVRYLPTSSSTADPALLLRRTGN